MYIGAVLFYGTRMSKQLRMDIVTIFPEIVDPYLHAAMLGRGEKAGVLKFCVHDLRHWTHDRHKTVDDRPFGGGAGMVMKVAPFHDALVALRLRKKDGSKTTGAKRTRVILTSAKGKRFTQRDAERLATYDRLVFLCGRYEGVDERVAKHLADEELSIGDFVLTGGELAALAMTDATARLRPGVLGREESLVIESHGKDGFLEYPQYTRPEVYICSRTAKKSEKAWLVPQVLLSGDHRKIVEWRKNRQKETADRE